MRINKITMSAVKGQTCEQELTGRDIIVGHNGSGKTARAQALSIALLGYAPGCGERPADTMRLASDDTMSVGVETDSFRMSRTFARKDGKISTSLAVFPPDGEKTNKDKEDRVTRELGSAPVMLDFGEFAELSDMKRREFIFGLARPSLGCEWTKDGITEMLREYLPDDGPTLSKDVLVAIDTLVEQTLDAYPPAPSEPNSLAGEGMIAFPPVYDPRQMAAYMHNTAKAVVSESKARRDRSAAASLQLADYKNSLEDTDRGIDALRENLQAMRAQQIDASEALATATEQNSAAIEKNHRISELRHEISQLEDAQCEDDPDELRALIAQYEGDIREVDNAAEIADIEERSTKLQEAVDAKIHERQTLQEQRIQAQAERNATDELAAKLLAADGRCVIDASIACDTDFSGAYADQAAKSEAIAARQAGLTATADLLDDEIESGQAMIHSLADKISALRQAEREAVRDAADLRQMIDGLKEDLRRAESFGETRDAKLQIRRAELESILPPDGVAPWPTPDVGALRDAKLAIGDQIRDAERLLAEKEKARNALVSLKAAMEEGAQAEAALTAWKAVEAVTGPKGLMGAMVGDAITGLEQDVQERLDAMGVHKTFWIITRDDAGKDILRFGWADDGSMTEYSALSTGERMLLTAAFAAAITLRLDVPQRTLIVDNADDLDADNLKGLLDGLSKAGDGIDNIIVLCVRKPRVKSPWHVVDLGAEDAPAEGGAEA
jgi:exonuclease SbcC